MPRNQAAKTNKPFVFDRYPTKIKCTFRKSKLNADDFVVSASGDYTYSDEYEEDGCKITYNLRVNGKYQNRLFNADYPAEISVTGSPALWGVRFAACMPEKKMKLDDPQAVRTEVVSFTNKDISITATFEIKNSCLIEARKQKVKSRH